MSRVIVILFALAVLAGCKTTAFLANGYHHPTVPYEVRYSDPAKKTFVSADWRLDNYELDEDGTPIAAKTGKGWEGKRDLDGDGEADDKIALFDLKLQHRKNDGTLWVRTLVLPRGWEDRELKVVTDTYVEGLSGSGNYADYYLGGGPAGTKTVRQFGTKITQSKETKLDRFPGFEASIDVANLDQLKLDPESRSARIRVLFAKTDYWMNIYVSAGWVKLPIVMMIGYAASPRDFEANAADFDKFVALFEFGAAREITE